MKKLFLSSVSLVLIFCFWGLLNKDSGNMLSLDMLKQKVETIQNSYTKMDILWGNKDSQTNQNQKTPENIIAYTTQQ